MTVTDSTSNSPDDRPSIDDFISRLKYWKSVVSNYSKQQKSQWAFLHKHILNNSGESVVWRNKNEIIEILNKISTINAYNHMFYPDGGGQDFRFAKLSPEINGIEIWDDNNSCNIVFPKALHFETFSEHDEWNYFLLELNNVNSVFESDFFYEELVEDTPAHYVKSTYYDYGVYDYDTGNRFPDGYRLVARYTGGKILFVLKNGPYNKINGTYDARHNCCSCDEFRDYISSLITKSRNYAKGTSSFLASKVANINPFVDNREEKEPSKGLIDSHTVSEETCFSIKFSIPELKDNQIIESAKYYLSFQPNYLSFQPNDGNFSLDSKEIRLCNDGYLHKMESEDFENVLFLNSRVLAHKIKINCTQQLSSFADKELFSFFTVNIIRISKPTHLFSKEEIEEVMRNADDRKHNTLVIDEDGYPKIICNNELDIESFPVRHDQWNARNLDVGKYSNLSTLDETYISSLQGWLLYLESKKSVYMDLLYENKNEKELIAAIEAIE